MSIMGKTAAVLKQLAYPLEGDAFDGAQVATPIVFGSGQKTSSYDNDQNMKPFINPYSGIRSGFVYGKEEYKFGLEWIFSDSLFFKYLLGDLETRSNDDRTYLYAKTVIPCFNFVTVDQSVHTGAYWERVKNAICTGVTISSSINNELAVKGNFMAGNYDSNTNTDYDAIAQPTDTISKPLMFSNVAITGVDGVVLASVQSFDLTLNNGGFVDYGCGSKSAVVLGKEVLEVNGKITLRYKDGANAKYVNDRIEQTSLLIKMVDGNRTVTITLGGIGLGKRELPAIGEAKIVDEVVSFDARSIRVQDEITV